MELFKIFGTLGLNGVKETNDQLDDTTDKAENSESKMSSAFKKIGAAVVTYFAVDKIIEFGKAVVDASAEVSAEQSAFVQIMGDYSDEASEKVKKIADATGMVDTRLTPYMTSMTAKFKGLGYGIDDATNLASDGLNLAADAAAFWDKSLDDSMGALNSFINGSYEGGEAIGLFANDTQLASYAVKNGIVSETKEWASLDEARKQATRLEYAQKMFEMSGATGQAAKEADQYANVQANLTEKWRQFKAQIGEPILQNIVLPAMDKLSGIVDVVSKKFQSLKTYVSENQDKIQSLKQSISNMTTAVEIAAGAFVALKAGMAIQKLVTGFQNAELALKLFSMQSKGTTIAQATLNGTLKASEIIVALLTGKMTLASLAQTAMTKAQVALNAVLTANPIGLIIAAIAALIAIFIILWKKCEWFRNFWIGLWQKIKVAFQAFIDWISPAIEVIKVFFTSLWKKITEIASAIWNSVKPIIDAMINAFQQAWELIKVVWDAVRPYFSALWESIKVVFEAVKPYLEAIFKGAWEAIKFIWSIVAPYFKTVWENIKLVFSVVKTFLGGAFRTAWEAIKAVWNTVTGFFKAIWDTIAGIFSVVKDVLTGNWKGAWDGIKGIVSTWTNFFSGIWESIKKVFGSVGKWFGDTFKAAWNAIKGVFSNWGSFFSGLWDKIKSTFSKIGTNIASAIGSAVKAGINGVIRMIENTVNGAVGLINGAINLINKIPGVSIGKIKKLSLPRLAKGGIIDKSTIANVGEDGTEAVVPLEKNTGWMNEIATRLNDLQNNQNNGGSNKSVIDKLDELIDSIKALKIYLYGDTLVGELAPAMDSALGDINRLRGRGQ